MKISKKVKNIMKVSALLAIVIIAGSSGINQTAIAANNAGYQNSQAGNSNGGVQNADFGPYMKRMQDKIKSYWRPPIKDKNAQIVVKYRIRKDGTLDSYGILSSSGYQDLDSAAIEALRSAAPFEPLPASFNKESILVQFTFDYQKPKAATQTVTAEPANNRIAQYQPIVPVNNQQTQSQPQTIPAGTPVTPIKIKANPGEEIQIQKLPPKQKVFPPVRAVQSYEQTPATIAGSQQTVQKYIAPPESIMPPAQVTQVYTQTPPPPTILEPIQPPRAIVPLPPKNTDPRNVAVPPPIRQTPSVDVKTYAQGDLLDLDKSKITQDTPATTAAPVIIQAGQSAGPTPVNATQINRVVPPSQPEIEYVRFEAQEEVPVNTMLSTGINKVAMPTTRRKKLTKPVEEEQYPNVPEYKAVPTSAPPGREPGVYVTPVKVTDFSEYMRKVERRITKKWKPPLSDYSTKVVVNYVIHKNGELGNYYVAESSGNSRMDLSAMQALKKAAPFDPLPVGFGEESVDVKFTFDYNVYKNKSEKKGIKELEEGENL